MSELLNEIVEDSTGATEAGAVDSTIEGNDQSATQEDAAENLPETIVYDIDGEEVSLDDIKKWKSGHMKDADYTKKTQSLAGERKAFLEKQEQLGKELEFFTAMKGEIEDLVMGDLKGVDLNALLDDDATEYLKTKERMESRKSKLTELKGKFSELEQRQLQAAQSQLHETLGWADPEKRQSDIDHIVSYAKDVGLTDSEFAQVKNPKVMATLLDAAKYRKLKQGQPETTKKVKQAPKTSKPSTKTPTKKLTQWQRMYGAD